eukprot:CAMPEP_0204059928 /NCGR_PEP_ID=MMETSP0360-20130528/138875_1 /ASSEMBLY_ACC=CAM_ASM_000342 /TAXON_ID=268821 /ORGANISM="Scrippsiella Hangoei, Strain SHTV-5" /LENGTH=74 /DNA_ID=CAMNT_0051007569 /DNA_START=56 /DNA_END=277 /DNA_ORIENTATION=-
MALLVPPVAVEAIHSLPSEQDASRMPCLEVHDPYPRREGQGHGHLVLALATLARINPLYGHGDGDTTRGYRAKD